jgi:hypothetical protein
LESHGNDAAIGFFCTDSLHNGAISGGYLLLNFSGRPLEFHCSVPVRPTRAHEIFYGSKLAEHLASDLIGPALLQRPRISPILLCIDSTDAAGIVLVTDIPVALVAGDSQGDDSSQVERVIPMSKNQDRVQECLTKISGSLDLAEPFQRIREALREAQQPARAA